METDGGQTVESNTTDTPAQEDTNGEIESSQQPDQNTEPSSRNGRCHFIQVQ